MFVKSALSDTIAIKRHYIDVNILHKILANQIQQQVKRITHDQVEFIPVILEWFNTWKPIYMIQYVNRIQNNHLNTWKSIKNQQPIMVKYLNK